MESQVTTAADGEKNNLNLLRLSPEHLTFLEILRDSAAIIPRNFVPRKPEYLVEEQSTDCCSEQVAKAKHVQTLSPVLPYRRRKTTCMSAGNIALLARLLRSAAIRRSLNFVLSVPTFPRPPRFILKVEQTKIVAATLQLSPVPEPTTIICPPPVDINVVDEDVSAGGREPKDAVGAVGTVTVDLLEGTSDTNRIRRRRPILRAIVRRLSKISRRLCCWCGTPSSVRED